MHQEDISRYVMPEEGLQHKRTWMAFPTDSPEVYGRRHRQLLNGLRMNIALIAKTISKYEQVNLIVHSEYDATLARNYLEQIGFESKFEILFIVQPLNDLWLRDSGPAFVRNASDGTVAVVDFNFNGWGKKQYCVDDSRIAQFISNYTSLKALKATLVLEGGGIEVDGNGTAILAESCVLNKNRNPNKTKADVETELSNLLGVTKCIWVPGVRGMDITDGHIDFYAKFAGSDVPGVVFVHLDDEDPSTYETLSIIQNSTDVNGRGLTTVILKAPNAKSVRRILASTEDTALGYTNFYLCNGAVICAEFGDAEMDRATYQILSEVYPNRAIEQLNIDFVAIAGGGVHCTTQQEPQF